MLRRSLGGLRTGCLIGEPARLPGAGAERWSGMADGAAGCFMPGRVAPMACRVGRRPSAARGKAAPGAWHQPPK